MRRTGAIVGLLVGAAIGMGLALAQRTPDEPRMDLATARIEAKRTRTIEEKICRGTDGHYRHANDEYKGTIKGGDPRLTGNVVIRGPQLLNLKTGFGANRADVIVTEPGSGKVSARLQLIAVFGPQRGIGNGVVIGDLRAEGDRPAGRITANYRGLLDFQRGTLTAEMGSGNKGAFKGQNSAVVDSGGCGVGDGG